MQKTKVYVSYNPFFLVPFLIWLVVGAGLLLGFDRKELFSSINSHYSNFGDVMMSLITFMGEGIFIFPVVALLFIAEKKYRNWRFFAAIGLANIGAFLLSQILKSAFNYPRPLLYFQEAGWIHILPEWERYFQRSFPSGHATGAFAILCFLSLLLVPKNRGWGLLFFILAFLVGYSRVYLAAHFFADVYVGSIIGTFFSILAVAVFYKKTLSVQQKI